jgi:hypothetical protein
MKRLLAALACVVLSSACSAGEPWRITDSTTTLGGDDDEASSSGPVISASATVSASGTSSTASSSDTSAETMEPVEGSSSTTTDPLTTTSGVESTGSTSSGGLESSTTATPSGIDLSGWTIVQTESDRTFEIPGGTFVPEGGTLVVGRDADQASFEAYWGVTFDGDVVYLSGDDQFPTINGDETYTLRDDGGAIVDGPSPALVLGESMARIDPEDDGATGWASATADVGTPEPGDSVDPPGGFVGAFVSEASDANGIGNFIYEFVELRVF